MILTKPCRTNTKKNKITEGSKSEKMKGEIFIDRLYESTNEGCWVTHKQMSKAQQQAR